MTRDRSDDDPVFQAVSLGKRIIFAVITGLTGVILALGVSEVVLRFLKRDIAFQPDPDVIRSLRPNVQRVLESFETDDNLNGRSEEIPATPRSIGYLYTNNVGLRMSKDIGPKAPGERRVLVLGDSYTEALEYPEGIRFDNVAQRLLNESETKDEPWAVINGGIQNGSPSQYVLLLRRYLPLFEPDVVVVVTGANDLWDDMQFSREYGFVLDDEGLPLEVRARTRLWLLQNSYLLRYLYVLLGRFDRPLMGQVFSAAEPSLEPHDWRALACSERPEVQEEFRKRTGHYLVGMRDLTERAGAHFGVLLIHYSFSFEEEPFYEPRFPGLRQKNISEGCYVARGEPYSRFVGDFLQRNGISYQDTLGAFSAAKDRSPDRKLWNFYDYHFSAAGHALAGRELFELVNRSLEAGQGLPTADDPPGPDHTEGLR